MATWNQRETVKLHGQDRPDGPKYFMRTRFQSARAIKRRLDPHACRHPLLFVDVTVSDKAEARS